MERSRTKEEKRSFTYGKYINTIKEERKSEIK